MQIPVRLEELDDGDIRGNWEKMVERDKPNLEMHSIFSLGKELVSIFFFSIFYAF